ncbi:MAG: TfoX/Sxy family protein [Alphaproteobacteria bacterium]|nr:TfoX/Sxy family protein [Alphaproteobacteria bacterium]
MPLTIADVIRALSPFGDITERRMFGGYGIYKEGVIIALMDEASLFFKSTPTTEPFYQSFGSFPFVYEGKDRPVKMSYWQVPQTVLNNPTILKKWVETAYHSSIESKTKKPQKPMKRRV